MPKAPRKTYRCSGNLVAAAGTFPFITIAGAAGRIVRMTKIKIHSPVLTTAQLLRIAVQKLSAMPTGGTGSNPTKVPLNTEGSNAASLATVTVYTAAPTAGTVVGQISERTVIAQSSTLVPSAALDEGDFDWTPAEDNTEFPTLRSATEGLAVLFPVAPATAVTFSYMIEYTEDGN